MKITLNKQYTHSCYGIVKVIEIKNNMIKFEHHADIAGYSEYIGRSVKRHQTQGINGFILSCSL